MIEKLGPYRIQRMLGRGGMGTVYAGVHEETGQWAAIKALSTVLAVDGNFRDRFVAEIETLKKLHHPNVVQLYGEGEQDGQLFYVMELVEGQTLQQELLSGHHFDWLDVTRIAIEVCRALKHAHDRGVIHRDLKPANLLRTQEGQIKLSDFGIAKLFGATHLTAAGSVVGTADYMAPEQAEGRPVTNRTDLYSLGNVMFTLLARRPPFAASSLPQVIYKLRYEEPPPVRRFAPNVPAELERIIHQLLEKDPRDRIPTALALSNRLQAMEHALSGKTRADQPPGGSATSIESPVSPDEQATRASEFDHGSATELFPTEVDSEGDRPNRRDYSWNEATAATSDAVPVESAGRKPSQGIEADRFARPQTRFTTIDEEARRAEDRGDSTADTVWDHMKTGGLALALLGMIAATIWAVWPASADTLYDRIIAIRNDRGAEDAKEYLDEFLERFPNDPRREEVRDLWMDVECKWLASRLRRKSKTVELERAETAYLEGMRIMPKRPKTARDRFVALIETFSAQQDASEEVRKCLEAARHQVKRLDEMLDGESHNTQDH